MDPKKATAAVSENARLILDRVDAKQDTSIEDLSLVATSTTDLSNEWIKKILPKMTSVSKEIINYDPTFQSTYQQLMEMVKAGQTTDIIMQQVLAMLVSIFEKYASDASSIKEATMKFWEGFTDAQLYQRIVAATEQVNTSISKLNQEAELLDERLHGVDLVLPYERQDIINKSNELKKKANLLSPVKGQLGDLQKAITNIRPAAGTVVEGWAELNDGLNRNIDRLKQMSTGQPGISIEAELQAVNEDWKITVERAKDLNPAN